MGCKQGRLREVCVNKMDRLREVCVNEMGGVCEQDGQMEATTEDKTQGARSCARRNREKCREEWHVSCARSNWVVN